MSALRFLVSVLRYLDWIMVTWLISAVARCRLLLLAVLA